MITLPTKAQRSVMLYMLAFSLVGCGGGVAIKNDEPQLARAASTTTSPNSIGTTNYHKILDDLGLKSVFTYGKVYETTNSVTIPLTPRDINSDQRTGRIIKETQLLSKLGNRVTSAVSNKTGISPSRIEIIVYEKKCKAHIINAKVTENCDRDSTIVISQQKDDSLKKLIHALEGIHNSNLPQEIKEPVITSLLGTFFSEKTFNKKNVKEFCEKSLRKNLKNFNLKTDCIIVERWDGGKKVFVIKDIKTEKFITKNHPEKFNVNISNVFDEDNPLSRNGVLSIPPSEAYFRFEAHKFWKNKDYPDNIKILPDHTNMIENTEPKISAWAEEFFNK